MLNQGSLKGMTTATAAGRFGTTETAAAACIRRFKTSDDGTDWTVYTGSGKPGTKYVRVGY